MGAMHHIEGLWVIRPGIRLAAIRCAGRVERFRSIGLFHLPGNLPNAFIGIAGYLCRFNPGFRRRNLGSSPINLAEHPLHHLSNPLGRVVQGTETVHRVRRREVPGVLRKTLEAVSYTHLTLPTIYSV